MPPVVAISSPTAIFESISRCSLARLFCGRIIRKYITPRNTTGSIIMFRRLDPPAPPAAWAYAEFMKKSIGLHQFLAACAGTQSRALYSRGAQTVELRCVRLEAPEGYCRANLRHQPLVEKQIVDGVQARAKNLAALVQMTQVAAAVVQAGVAAAVVLDRSGLQAVSGVADVDDPAAREQMRVARMARGHHAIEHVDAAAHRLQDVLGPSHAHEVARLVRGHQRQQRVQHLLAFRFGLADREAADGEACETDLLE